MGIPVLNQEHNRLKNLGENIESRKRTLFVGSEAKTCNQLGSNIGPNGISHYLYGARESRNK